MKINVKSTILQALSFLGPVSTGHWRCVSCNCGVRNHTDLHLTLELPMKTLEHAQAPIGGGGS